MKVLLTSAGISNASIHTALVDLLGKPVSEASAVFIPSAIYGIRNGGDIVRRVICGQLGDPFCDMGWKSLGLLELTALPSIKKELWVPLLQETDVLLVGGGDCQYLTYWMRQSGLAELLPSLLERLVYVGLSAGSMIMTSYGTTYGNHVLPPETAKSLGFFEFAIHPHLDYPAFPDNSLANLERLAATLPMPSYLIDDATAIKVTDGGVEVISEGKLEAGYSMKMLSDGAKHAEIAADPGSFSYYMIFVTAAFLFQIGHFAAELPLDPLGLKCTALLLFICN